MKYYFLILNVILIGAIFLSSCQDEEEQILNESTENNNLKTAPGVTGYVYHATWDAWGRAHCNCDCGWGLCRFRDCWFCCIDDVTGEVVDCETGQTIDNVGTVYLEEECATGYMEIEMDPGNEKEKEAIENQLPFYIDEDIIGDKYIVLKGEYKFDGKVGVHGGYIIDVVRK